MGDSLRPPPGLKGLVDKFEPGVIRRYERETQAVAQKVVVYCSIL